MWVGSGREMLIYPCSTHEIQLSLVIPLLFGLIFSSVPLMKSPGFNGLPCNLAGQPWLCPPESWKPLRMDVLPPLWLTFLINRWMKKNTPWQTKTKHPQKTLSLLRRALSFNRNFHLNSINIFLSLRWKLIATILNKIYI